MSKKLIDVPQGMNKEQLETFIKVSNDPFNFAHHVFIIHPVNGKVPFDLFPYQKKVLYYFLKNRFNIILKFRQGGLTELISMYCLWFAMYHTNKNIQIISIKDRVAKKVLRRIKYMYRNLPWYLRVPVINGRPGDIGTSSELEFSNGSLITSIPTTEEAGRSEAVSLLVIDEAAIVRWASQIWAAAMPTLSTGGSAILNSTPFGIGNLFHKTWVDAVAGGNNFTPIRLFWRMHPERDDAWYKTMADALGPRRTAQEIDGDFLTSGNSVFDLTDIKAIEDSITEVEPYQTLENGKLVRVFPPDHKTRKTIAADVASGRSKDYSAFSTMDRTGREYTYFKGKIGVSRFAEMLMKEGKLQGNALLAPESNDIGLAVTSKIQDHGYPNLYYTTRFLKEKGKGRPIIEKVPGWYTTSKNRHIIIEELEEDVRQDTIETYDRFFVDEAYTFIYDEANRPVAMGKETGKGDGDFLDDGEGRYTDDSILAKAINNHIRKGKVTSAVVTPR
jgi:hypothetical protein